MSLLVSRHGFVETYRPDTQRGETDFSLTVAQPASDAPAQLSSESPGPLIDSGYDEEDASRDATAVFGAAEPGVFGWGSDEDAIFEVLEGLLEFDGELAGLTDAQKVQLHTQRVERLAQAYHDHYKKNGSGRDLRANIREELKDTPDDWVRAQALLDGDPIAARAAHLHMKLDRHEDDEFMAMLQQTPAEDRAALAQAYAREYAPDTDWNDPQAAQDALLSAMEQRAQVRGRSSASRQTFSDAQIEEARALFATGAGADQTVAEAAAERAHGHIDDGVVFGWGSEVNMDGLRETIDTLSPRQRELFATVYEDRYGDELADDVADIGNDDQGREIELLLSSADAADPEAGAQQQIELTASRLRQDNGDTDALREQLEPMSPAQIQTLLAEDPDLRQDLLDKHDGDDKDEIRLLLEKPEAQSPELAAWQAEYDAIRVHRALDGLNDEDLLRRILRPKTLPQIQAMSGVYETRYENENLRDRLVSELGARDEKEIIEQMFDLGAIDLQDPREAIAERIRRVRELQAFEGDSDFTSFAQRLGRWDWDYETDPERLERNLSDAEDALENAGDDPQKLAEAARLAGFSEADIETLVQTKDSAATYAATGGAIIGSTAAIVFTGGSATPLVVAGWSAAAGAAGAGGTYALVNHQAGGAEIARETLIGGVGGATVLPVTRGGLVALETGGLQAIRANTTIGVANGASTGFTAAATDSHTWENGWQDGAQIVLVNTTIGAGTGAVLAPAVSVTAQGLRAFHRTGADSGSPTLTPDGATTTPADPIPVEATDIRVEIVPELAEGQTGAPVINENGDFLGYAVQVSDPTVRSDTLAIEGAVPNTPPPSSGTTGQSGATGGSGTSQPNAGPDAATVESSTPATADSQTGTGSSEPGSNEFASSTGPSANSPDHADVSRRGDFRPKDIVRWRTTDEAAAPKRFDAQQMDALPRIEGTDYRMHWDETLEAWLPVRPIKGVAGVAGERAISVRVMPDGSVRPLWSVSGGSMINTRLSAARQRRAEAGISDAERLELLQKANRYFNEGRTEAGTIDSHDRNLLASYLNYFNPADDFTAARTALTENGHLPENQTLLDLADVIDYLETPPPTDMAAFRAEHGITWREYNLQNQVDAVSAYNGWTYVYDLELNTTHPGAWLPAETRAFRLPSDILQPGEHFYPLDVSGPGPGPGLLVGGDTARYIGYSNISPRPFSEAIGPRINSGGEKIVHQFGDNHVIALYKPNRFGSFLPSLAYRESTALHELRQIFDGHTPGFGERYVIRDHGPFVISPDALPPSVQPSGERLGIIYPKYIAGSKDSVFDPYQDPVASDDWIREIPNQRTLDDIQNIKTVLRETNTRVNDFQVLLAADGGLVIADPQGITRGGSFLNELNELKRIASENVRLGLSRNPPER